MIWCENKKMYNIHYTHKPDKELAYIIYMQRNAGSYIGWSRDSGPAVIRGDMYRAFWYNDRHYEIEEDWRDAMEQ